MIIKNGTHAVTAALITASVLSAGLVLAPSAEAATTITTAITFARAQIGDKYSQVNPQGPNHWDCSGLMQASYKKAGKSIPRTAATQYNSSKIKHVSYASRKPGDLVFFKSHGSVYHVGIYVGVKYDKLYRKNKNEMINAPSYGKKVRQEAIYANWSSNSAISFGRVK
jgi:cell wall-associated NlpC family hydrolase